MVGGLTERLPSPLLLTRRSPPPSSDRVERRGGRVPSDSKAGLDFTAPSFAIMPVLGSAFSLGPCFTPLVLFPRLLLGAGGLVGSKKMLEATVGGVDGCFAFLGVSDTKGARAGNEDTTRGRSQRRSKSGGGKRASVVLVQAADPYGYPVMVEQQKKPRRSSRPVSDEPEYTTRYLQQRSEAQGRRLSKPGEILERRVSSSPSKVVRAPVQIGQVPFWQNPSLQGA